MRTKKTIVHGKHSRKRSNLLGINGKSQRKGSKIQRTHTRKVGGALQAIRRSIINRKKENPNCEVSFEKFENSKCFQEAIYKKLNQAITEFLSVTEFFDAIRDQNSNFKIHYDNQASLLFTKIKRVLMPYLVNVMEMRIKGTIFDDIYWDLGYNTLIMLIILKNISSVIYDKATNGDIFDLTTIENDLKKSKPNKESEVIEEVKKLKKCLDGIRCLELNPNSISQILYFYFILSINEDSEKQKTFITRLGKLIQEKKGKKLQLQAGGGGKAAPGGKTALTAAAPAAAAPRGETAPAAAPAAAAAAGEGAAAAGAAPPPAPPAAPPAAAAEEDGGEAPAEEAAAEAEGAAAAAPPAAEAEAGEGAAAEAEAEAAAAAEAEVEGAAPPPAAPAEVEGAAPEAAAPEAAEPAAAPAPTEEDGGGAAALEPAKEDGGGAAPAEVEPPELPPRNNTDLKRLMSLVTTLTDDTETNTDYKTMVNTFLNSLTIHLGVSGEINGKVIYENLRYFTEKGKERKTTDLFSICKKIFHFFKTNASIDFKLEKNQLTHEEHLLCVGEIPEYMSEFDVPTQFRSKSKSIEDLGWRHSKFKKLELAVFLNNNKERTNQAGGDVYSKAGNEEGPERNVEGSETGPGGSEKGFQFPSELLEKGLIPPDNNIYAAPNPINNGNKLSLGLSNSEINVRKVPSFNNPAYQESASSSRPNITTVNPAYNGEQVIQAPECDVSSTERVKTLDVKVFSIFQRIDNNNNIGLNKYIKNYEYFVKYRLPSLILNKYQVSGKPKESRYFGLSAEKGKRMSFNYPIRFGRTFSKFVNLMLEESMYYKSLEEGGENVENFVNKYKAYEKERCRPYKLEITETGSSPSKTRGPSTVNPIYGPSQTVPPGTNGMLKGIPVELYELLIKVLEAKQRRGAKFNEKALAQMINELISALRISKLERDTAGGDNDDSGNEDNDDSGGGNDDIINQLWKVIEILTATERDLIAKRKELLAQMEEIAENLNGAEQLLADKTAELEAKTAELEAKTAELEAEKLRFIELRRSFREKLAEMNSQFETKRLEMERKIAELEQKLQGQNEHLHRLQIEFDDKALLADVEQNRANYLERQLAQEKGERVAERAEALKTIKAAQKIIAELKAEIEALRQQNSQLMEQKEALGASLTRLEDVERQKNLLLTENERLNTLILGLRGELREAQAEAQAARAEQEAQAEGNFLNEETIRTLREKIERLKEENRILKTRLEDERAGFEQAQEDLRNKFERFKTSLNEQTKAGMERLEEENRSLSAKNDKLERALEACEEQKVELQGENDRLRAENEDLKRQLTECQTQKEAGGGSAPGGGRQCVEVNIDEEFKKNICKVMNRLIEKNPYVKTDLTNLIIIHDSGTYKQIPYADISKQCSESGTTKFVGSIVDISKLKSYTVPPLIFNITKQSTQFLDLEFMKRNYNEANLTISYPENATNLPINYRDGKLVINERFFRTGRGGTRTKKLNRVNKSRKKSKKINF